MIDRPRFERQDVTPRLHRGRTKDNGSERRGEGGVGSQGRTARLERESARRDFEVATRYPYAWPRPPLDWGLNDAQTRSRAGGRRHGAVRIGPEDRKLKLRARSNEACEQQRLGWDDAEPERWRR